MITVSEDSKYIVSVSSDKNIAIWSIYDKTLVHLFDCAHQAPIQSILLTGYDKYIISGSVDKSIAVWDFRNRKLVQRIESAHGADVNVIIVTPSDKYFVSGSDDHSIALWALKSKTLVHRFRQAQYNIVSLAVTKDSRYMVSGAQDNTIALWDIEQRSFIHRFQSNMVFSISFTGDDRYLVGSDGNISSLWDFQAHRTNMTDLIALLDYSQILTEAFDPECSYCPETMDISFIQEMVFFSKRWNFLNFVIFLLPKVRPVDYLNFVRENHVYLSLDVHSLTQLHYLLDYSGPRTPVVYEFCSLFFKQMSNFINFDSLGREKLLKSLAKLTVKIYQTQLSISLLGYLRCFVRPAQQIFESGDYEKLPNQGNLRNGKDQAFIKLKSIAVPDESEILSVILKPETNDPTLQYELVLLPLDYYGNSTDTFHLLNVFESFGVEDTVLYEDPTVGYLIDFLWEKFKVYLYLQVSYFAANTVLYTVFGIYYQDIEVSTPILIITVGINILALAFEGLQATSGVAAFFGDPWNYFEVITPLFQIISAILYWTAQGSLTETIFISTSILLLYTKLLITMRVFDSLRHMIRMILEILSDSKGFMIVIFTYAIGLTIAVYHNREVQQDSDGSGIYALNDVFMEMYAFAIGSWDYTEYAGINIAFFLFASFLLPLVLLNMLIALMGDTYGRVQDNRLAFDSREGVDAV